MRRRNVWSLVFPANCRNRISFQVPHFYKHNFLKSNGQNDCGSLDELEDWSPCLENAECQTSDCRADFGRFPWCSESSIGYLIYRAATFVYFAGWLVYMLMRYHSANVLPWLMIYFTNWTFILLSFTNFIALIVSIKEYQLKAEPTAPFSESLPTLYWFYWVCNTVVSVASMVICIGFWTVLYDPVRYPANPLCLHVHGINGLYVLLNAFVSAVPWKSKHVWASILYTGAYSGFTMVYYSLGGKNHRGETFIYPAIDYEHRPMEAVVLMGFFGLIGVPMVHFVFSKLSQFCRTCFGPPLEILGVQK